VKIALVLTMLCATGSAFALWVSGALVPEIINSRPDLPHSPQRVKDGRICAVGYVEPATEVRKLTFKIDGLIETCHVQLGQVVEAGEVLATLRNRDEQAAVAVAEKELLLAQAECAKLLSGVHPRQIEACERRIARFLERTRHAQRQHDRQAELIERKAGTIEGFEQATTDLEQAKEDLLEAQAELGHLQTHVRAEDRALAEAQVALAQANLQAAKEHCENTNLLAPMRGTVLEVFKRQGESVRAFDVHPVVIFADVSQLRVRTEIDERYTSQVRIGQPATISGRSLGEKTFQGRITQIKNLMGNKTIFSRDAAERKDLDVLQVFIEPDEPLQLPVGLQVDVEIRPQQQ